VTHVSTKIKAIMLLPVGAAIDGIRAQICLIHSERRGYKLIGTVFDWAAALSMLRAKEAEVVVLADPDDFKPDWTPRVEYAGDETQDLVRYGRIRHRNDPPNAGDSRNRRPGPIA